MGRTRTTKRTSKKTRAVKGAGRQASATSPETVDADGLTDKQRVFVEEYLKTWNATDAARRAGYKDPEQAGYENKRKQEVATLIQQRLTSLKLSADEVLARLSEMATSDLGDFLMPRGKGVSLDLKRAKDAGKLHLLKKYSKTKQGVSIELYDAKDALVQIGKYHGLFAERVKLETWQSELIEQVKSGVITPDEVITELGEDGARAILVAAGQVIVSRAPAADSPGEQG
jgi:phage terminase small subunit